MIKFNQNISILNNNNKKFVNLINKTPIMVFMSNNNRSKKITNHVWTIIWNQWMI
jgi:hypothetical protein